MRRLIFAPVEALFQTNVELKYDHGKGWHELTPIFLPRQISSIFDLKTDSKSKRKNFKLVFYFIESFLRYDHLKSRLFFIHTSR